ncbi:MAG: hypothetical protein LIO58_00215 [Oscillospiraceae bacterium]|nr:hypothetical protein [Oscillospiraceae bacterium]
MSDKTERKTTFVVQISDGKNASLQGRLIWVDHNITRSFQSTTELMHLIDSLREKLAAQDENE